MEDNTKPTGTSSDVCDMAITSVKHPDDQADRLLLGVELMAQVLFILLPILGLVFLIHQGIVHLWRMCWSGFCT